MIYYIIKTSLCLAIFLSFYLLVLRKEKMLVFNRFYLVSGLLLSFLIPLIKLPIPSLFSNSISLRNESFFEAGDLFVIPSDQVFLTGHHRIWDYLPLSIYFLITVLLLCRFGYRIAHLLINANKSKQIKTDKGIIVLQSESHSPYAFWKYVFVNSNDYNEVNFPKELITHEFAHIEQLHTIDIILAESLRILFWFNPLVHWYKKAIQLNHELLADTSVIEKHKNILGYQHLLLNSIVPNQKTILTSSFNYFITKNRLKMMKKNTTTEKKLGLSLLCLPMVIGLLMTFSTSSIAQDSKRISEDSRITNEVYFKDATFMFEDKEGKKIYCDYSALSEKRKNTLPPPPPKKGDLRCTPLPKGTLVTLTEDGKVTIGKGDHRIPPPPPAPPKPLKKRG